MDLCLVAHFAYGALTGSTDGHIGGVERQVALMSKWLAARGHHVSVVTWEENGPQEEVIDGVRVLKVCRRDAGLPLTRFFHPRWTGLNRALREADAQVYYQNCAEVVTGQVALWARRNDRRFVFSVASDPETDPALPVHRSLRERWLYRYGLTHADQRLVQTQAQRSALEQGFGLSSKVQKMPTAVNPDLDIAALLAIRDAAPRVLWIGRFDPVKNVELLFEVAERLPAVHFDVVGGEDQDPDYAERMMRQGERLPNVELHGRCGPAEVQAMLGRSSLLLCTSLHEGFPNTFIESWSYGRPIVSTVDPDELIQRLQIGAIAEGAQALSEAIAGFIEHPRKLDEASHTAREYFLAHHELERAMQAFEQVFAESLDEAP